MSYIYACVGDRLKNRWRSIRNQLQRINVFSEHFFRVVDLSRLNSHALFMFIWSSFRPDIEQTPKIPLLSPPLPTNLSSTLIPPRNDKSKPHPQCVFGDHFLDVTLMMLLPLPISSSRIRLGCYYLRQVCHFVYGGQGRGGFEREQCVETFCLFLGKSLTNWIPSKSAKMKTTSPRTC